MALILRQSTSIDIRMGPFVDATDGVTPQTGVTLGAADQAEVLKADGAATVAMGGAFNAVTGCDGWYDYTAATGDVDTIGECEFVVQDSSVCLPVRKLCMVVDAVVYDAIYGSSPTLLTARDVGQLYESTVGTVNSQTSFDMDTTIVSNDNWIGNTVTIEDVTNGETVTRYVTDVVQASDRIIINNAPEFTVAVGDIVRVSQIQHPTYALLAWGASGVPELDDLTAARDTITNAIRDYFRVALRSDSAISVDNATQVTAINADQGNGAGDYDNTVDSREAVSDRLPASLNANGNIDANVADVNDVEITGQGTTADPFGPV